MQFDFDKKFTRARKKEFADLLLTMSMSIGFRVSSRGWGYLMEQQGHITKAQFNKVENAINDCRKLGFLPVDFVAEDSPRAFSGIEVPSHIQGKTMDDILEWMSKDVLEGGKYFVPDWWEDETYYIQVVVEKIDLVSLFEPICGKFHIPIANARGWSSILQRAGYARRFQQAEEIGLQPVLLYCGDHDPDGLRISDTIRTNLEQLSNIQWDNGDCGYDPAGLIIDRIGLNYDFIKKHNYTWIDNLVTSSGISLANENHRNFNLPYVQDYIKTYGVRKCEANAIVTTPAPAAQLITESIEKYLGTGALARFKAKRDAANKAYAEILEDSGLATPIKYFLNSKK